jgi:ubiquinone biosynthesis protein UbiJ
MKSLGFALFKPFGTCLEKQGCPASRVVVAMLNHLFNQAAWARNRLRPHAGRSARLDLHPFVVDFVVNEKGFIAASSPASPEVSLSLPLDQIVKAISAGNGIETLMAQAQISGSADLAEALGFVFRHLRWDIGEDLSHVVGDIAAHRIVSAWKLRRSSQDDSIKIETDK